MKKIKYFFLIMFLVLIPITVFAETTTGIYELQNELKKIADELSKSVVYIGTEKTVTRSSTDPYFFFFNDPNFNDKFNSPDKEYKQSGLGSGVIYKKSGKEYFIITNNHVVEGADKISVSIDQDKFYDGEIVGSDPAIDVAIIKIKTSDDLQVADYGDSSKLDVGDFVVAIGNPYGLFQTMTFGIVSAVGRNSIASGQNGPSLTDFIQTDAAINPGNSGGPLIDIEGRVIGINTMIYSQSGGSVGIGFAIPINIVLNAAEQLINKGKVDHGYLGVYFQPITEELIKKLNIKKADEGMFVNQVFDESPAEKAGIKAGDILVELNGKPLKKTEDLTMTIGNSLPGQVVNFKVLRDNKFINFTVVLGNRDDMDLDNSGTNSSNSDENTENKIYDKYGFKLSILSDSLKKKYKIPMSYSGLVVTDIKAGSFAVKSGFKKGDLIFKVNNKAVKSFKDLDEILKESPDSNYYYIIRNKKDIVLMM